VKTQRRLMCTHSLLQPCNEVIPVFILLQASEGHFRARDILHSVRQGPMSMRITAGTMDDAESPTFFGFSRYSNSVFSSQVTPLLTLAAVYENPATVPLLRPRSLRRVPSMTPAPVPDRTTLHTHADLGRLCWVLPRRRYDTARTVF
jgi:hypothetical protein